MPSPPRAPEPGGVTLRPATADDLAALVALLADDELGARREQAGPPVADRYRAAFAAISADPGCELLVADAGGRVVGCLQLTVVTTLSRQGARRALIESVRVAGDSRGAGIGSLLVNRAVARARDRGCRLVQLASDRRRIRAHAFYRRLGFAASHEGMTLEL